MKIGVNTWVWTSPFSTRDFHLIPKVKRMGFDVLEVALDDASIIDAKLLRKMTEDNNLSVTVCGAFGPMRVQGWTAARRLRFAMIVAASEGATA